MSVELVTVDAQANCIAAQPSPNNPGAAVGGSPAIVKFKQPLASGDTLQIITPVTSLWNSGGGPEDTNADGVPIAIDGTIQWAKLNPDHPTRDPKGTGGQVTLPYPNAHNYNFGIGCLVGSLDSGQSFFAIGTNFQITILGNGLLSNTKPPSIPVLWLFYWDINCLDNEGQLSITVSHIPATS